MTSRASVDSDGNQANAESRWPSISGDGRYVAFVSEASNLVPNDTNGVEDVFVHDRQTGQTERVSIDSAGIQGNGLSGTPSISSDGRYVAFASDASNLVPNDTNNFCDTDDDEIYDDNCGDVFVHDRQTGQTQRISIDSAGTQGNGSSGSPSISADGHYVAFSSSASNLVVGDSNNSCDTDYDEVYDDNCADVFVHDRQTGQTERVSIDSAGNQGNGASGGSSISGDGRYVAFVSEASNLVPDDTNDAADVFVHDRQGGSTTRVSVDSAGSEADGASYGQSCGAWMSADGRYVAFYSFASNLVSGDTNGNSDIFVHDRQMEHTERVSTDSGGNQAAGQSFGSGISGNGRYVAFYSTAANIVPGDTNGFPDIFVRDRQTGQTTRVSVDDAGSQANGGSNFFSISSDGRWVAFESYASNLVPNDTNGYWDVFVRGWLAQPVGGIAEYPQLEPETVASTHDSPGTSALALAGLVTGAVLLLTAGAWYARRRWHRRTS